MAPDGQGRSLRELLDQLEEGIEELRVAYEKYFAGVERQAPAALHGKIERRLREAEAARTRSTAARFRLDGLRSRLVTYGHYWTRVLNQIENGTYRRHIERAQRRQRAEDHERAERAARESGPAPAAEGVPSAAGDAGAGDPSAPEAPGKAPPPPPPGGKLSRRAPPPPSVPGMQPGEVRALFDALVQAKRAAGEDVSGLTYVGLCKRLASEAPKLRERHGHVTFEVASDGGRVRLRAKTSP